MSQIFLVVKFLNPCGKICFWTLMTIISVSVLILQFLIRQFSVFGKMSTDNLIDHIIDMFSIFISGN